MRDAGCEQPDRGQFFTPCRFGLGLVQLILLGLTYAFGLWAFGDGSAALDLFRLGFSALAWMALWFVIGYAMYSFVFATMGATVSRLEDLQSLTYGPSGLLLPAYAIAAASLTGRRARCWPRCRWSRSGRRCSCRSAS